MRSSFRCVLVRCGLTWIDIGGAMYSAWGRLSKVAGAPFDNIVMDAQTGAKLSGMHVDQLLKPEADWDL